MIQYQPAILQAIPPQARYLTFQLLSQATPDDIVSTLESITIDNTVTGLGQSLLEKTAQAIDGMKSMPQLSANGINIPSTPADLWIWIGGDECGELLHRSRQLVKQLAPAFELDEITDAYKYGEGRDLTGYIDGTENPTAADAVEAAFVSCDHALAGSSFVSVQRWSHDLDRFGSYSLSHRDNIIGRHIEDNEEFDEAPESAHVKRTAQESFEPEAFMLRRSMPWSQGLDNGLMFVAFAHSFYPFEAQLNRMIGNEDGISDGLFEFSKPVTGAYFWCPPVADGKLLLAALKD